MYQPSIGSATGTRLDSAAKHTMACKVDSELFLKWFPHQKDARVNISQNKMKYAMQKDELVLNVTQSLDIDNAVSARGTTKAYPAVITSTGDMPKIIQECLAFLYSSPTGCEFLNRKKVDNMCSLYLDSKDDSSESDEEYKQIQKYWRSMPFFTVQGYALGTAWASEKNGDTVGTVLVGGMVTVRNGAFTCRAGEPIMFYFDFEESNFTGITTENFKEGERFFDEEEVNKLIDADERDTKNQNFEKNNINLPTAARKRARSNQYDSTPRGLKTGIALPKPYVLQHGYDVYGDRIRIFAKCISGGRPYDMIDLMLMTQSL